MNHSEAINIYYSLIEEYKGLPFPLLLPISETASEITPALRADVLKQLKMSLGEKSPARTAAGPMKSIPGTAEVLVLRHYRIP